MKELIDTQAMIIESQQETIERLQNELNEYKKYICGLDSLGRFRAFNGEEIAPTTSTYEQLFNQWEIVKHESN